MKLNNKNYMLLALFCAIIFITSLDLYQASCLENISNNVETIIIVNDALPQAEGVPINPLKSIALDIFHNSEHYACYIAIACVIVIFVPSAIYLTTV